jgi:UDP-GlcNAc:undecaprenyl-phosphate GlcNAc-1-phosphate transferase
MKSYVAAFAMAMVASLLLTPLVRAIALSRGMVARAGGRHLHQGRIPRIGGIALAVAWCLGLMSLLPFDGLGTATLIHAKRQLAGVVIGGLLLCGVGIVDDVRGMRVAHKIAAQVAVGVLAYVCEFRIEAVSLPFLGTLSMGSFALPVTILWIVGVTNAVNLIDGLDGLAAGVGLIAATTGFVLALTNGSPLVALALAALMGILVGFLFYNFSPARIFMGDSGSYFLGYVLATTSLAGAVQQKTSTAISMLVPMVALGLPIFDTLFSMLRRYIERRPLFAPDRGHVHHRLLTIGLTHRRVVVLLYGVSVALAVCAITISLGENWVSGGALLIATLVIVGLMRLAGYSEYLQRSGRSNARIYDALTERLRRALPGVLDRLGQARSERDVLGELRRLVGDAGCSAVEVRAEGKVVERLTLAPSEAEPRSLRRTYPVGPERLARSELAFVWPSDSEEPSAQASILLQLVADRVASALDRSLSELAPCAETEVSEPGLVPAAAIVSSSSRA